MYGHPKLVRYWAIHHKSKPTPAQVAQAALMRKAKASKVEYLKRQKQLFEAEA